MAKIIKLKKNGSPYFTLGNRIFSSSVYLKTYNISALARFSKLQYHPHRPRLWVQYLVRAHTKINHLMCK